MDARSSAAVSKPGENDLPVRASADNRRARSGILLLLGAAVLWSLNGALIKTINKDGQGPHGVTIAFYRSLIAGLFLLPLAGVRMRTLLISADGQVRPRGQTALCVLFFTLMTVSFVVANTLTQSANAIILQYTSTFWIFGLSPWLLREKPRNRDFAILLVAMAGIAVIFAGNASASLPGLLIALTAGLFFGLLTLMIRRLRGVDPAALTVVNNLGAAALLFVPALVIGRLVMTPREWALLFITGIVQFGIPYYFYSLALNRVPAYRAAIITMAEPVLVPIWTYMAVGETVPPHTVAGGAIILAALGFQTVSATARAPAMADRSSPPTA